MKKVLTFLMAVVLLLSLAACGGATAPDSAQGEDTVTITDHDGNVVTLPRDIQRVAVCGPYPLASVLAVFFDSADRLVGLHPNIMNAAKNSLLSELYPEILNAQTGFITGTEVNTEELAKLDPQVVFYGAGDTAIGEALRGAGFAAVAISANKWSYNAIETLNQWIALLGEIFPENDRATAVREYSQTVYDMVQERVGALEPQEKARVFFLFQYSDAAILTSGKQFFGQWWADAIGAVNVAEELENDNSVQVNLEQIYDWNPELIFITNFNAAKPQDLYDNTVGSYDWSGVTAVQQEAVYKMPLGMYRSYTCGVDTPVTLLWLAKTTYPELFADVDITESTIAYYQEVFGITLTAEQAERIFSPAAAAGDVKL